MYNKKYDLENRLVAFAGDAILFVSKFPNDHVGRTFKNQLTRSASSGALNFGEFQAAESTSDKIHKASISLKELKESRASLKILNYIKYGSTERLIYLLDECEQLIAILASIIKNRRKGQ